MFFGFRGEIVLFIFYRDCGSTHMRFSDKMMGGQKGSLVRRPIEQDLLKMRQEVMRWF